MKITEILLAEHAVLHNLFDHLEKAAPELGTLAEIKAAAATLKSLMAAHSKTEDELLIAPLEHCMEQIGQSETFHDEHEEIDRELLAVQKARTLQKGKELLLAAVIASRNHCDKEERVVFPMAEQVLKAKTLSALGDEWAKSREAAMAD